MLVLTRRHGETIVFGNDGRLSIRILRIQGNQVRIGINAPDEIPVYREEIFNKIKEEIVNKKQTLNETIDEISYLLTGTIKKIQAIEDLNTESVIWPLLEELMHAHSVFLAQADYYREQDNV